MSCISFFHWEYDCLSTKKLSTDVTKVSWWLFLTCSEGFKPVIEWTANKYAFTAGKVNILRRYGIRCYFPKKHPVNLMKIRVWTRNFRKNIWDWRERNRRDPLLLLPVAPALITLLWLLCLSCYCNAVIVKKNYLDFLREKDLLISHSKIHCFREAKTSQ